MTYEIWDRDTGFLLEDFKSEEQALDYLRDQVHGRSFDDGAKLLDCLQLVRLTDGGGTRTVVAEGVSALMDRIYVPVR